MTFRAEIKNEHTAWAKKDRKDNTTLDQLLGLPGSSTHERGGYRCVADSQAAVLAMEREGKDLRVHFDERNQSWPKGMRKTLIGCELLVLCANLTQARVIREEAVYVVKMSP